MKYALICVLALVSLTACGESRPCLRGHDDTYLQPYSFDGKTTTLIPQTQFVCDEYAPEPAR